MSTFTAICLIVTACALTFTWITMWRTRKTMKRTRETQAEARRLQAEARAMQEKRAQLMGLQLKAKERRHQVADWSRDAVRILEREGHDCTCEYIEEYSLCEPEPTRHVTRYDRDCPVHWPAAK